MTPRFTGLTNFSDFTRLPGTAPGEVVWRSPELATEFSWDELIPSWNVETPLGAGLKVEVRAVYPSHSTKFYNLGFWADDTAEQPRESMNGQKDADGDVATDTLVLNRPARTLQVRLTGVPNANGELPRLKFFGLSFTLREEMPRAGAAGAPARGRVLPVPERSQRSYPSGGDWCSPTSVSMVLGYWSAVLRRPELNVDVSEVAAGVFDRNWPGTGNWPFNTAFAGHFPGMRACVTRLAEEADLERLVAAGLPPIISVSFDLLQGKRKAHDAGHLVVCVGFTQQGDVVLNDPWALLTAGEKVRRVVPRENVRKAWAYSRRTVYLIYPETWSLPADDRGLW